MGGFHRWCWGGSVRDGEVDARLRLAADTPQVVHRPVEGEPHSFSDAGGASFRQLDSVEGLVDPEGGQLGSRKPLPAALAVEEEDEEEFLCGPELHPLSGSEDVQRRWRQRQLGKLRPAARARRPPHSGVHDLRRSWQLW